MSKLKPIATLVAGVAAIASVAAFAPAAGTSHAFAAQRVTASVVRPNPTCPPFLSPMHGKILAINHPCPG